MADSLDIEAVNRMRIAMGMKPIVVDGPAFQQETTEDGEEPASTLETREAAMDDNWHKMEQERLAKEERQKRKEAVKKARELAARSAMLGGPTLVDEDEVDMKSWLKGQNKRIAKAKTLEEEEARQEAARKAKISYTERDLAGVKVGHALSEFEDGEQILTLADKEIGEESDDDELEAAELIQKRKQEEKNEAKKKKQAYNPQDADQGLLAQYDEVIDGKLRDGFQLSAGGTITRDQIASNVSHGDERPKGRLIDLSSLLEEEKKPVSDYKEEKAPKIKKPKKSSKSTKRRKREEDEDLFPVGMEIDLPAPAKRPRRTADDVFEDDEDLQAQLALQRRKALKSRPRARPEDLARSIKEAEAAEMQDVVPSTEDATEEGLVFDAMSEFVSGMDPEQRRAEEAEERARKERMKKDRSFTPAAVPKQEDVDEDGDENMTMAELEEANDAKERAKRADSAPAAPDFGEEQDFSQGIGEALKLLRDRNLVDRAGISSNDWAAKQRFLQQRARIEEENDSKVRLQREKMRANGTLSGRDREELSRQQNERNAHQTARELHKAFENYQPKVNLEYRDKSGRLLDQKQAFKELSHAFHGKGSGKMKSEKRLKKIEEEKKRAATSILDSSKMAGAVSDAKKSKQAGVRLQ